MESKPKVDRLRSNGKVPQEMEIKRSHPGINPAAPENMEQLSPSQKPNGGLMTASFILVAAACILGMIVMYFIIGGR